MTSFNLAASIAEQQSEDRTMSEEIPNIEEQKSYYDERWGKESEKINRIELCRLIEILKSLYDTGINFSRQKTRICDLGCGRGWLSAELSVFGSVVGVDLSEKGVETARRRYPNVQFECADILYYDTGEKFDIVVSSEVVEHIVDKRQFFETVKKIMKNDGHVIITTPNKNVFKEYVRGDPHMQPLEKWPSMNELHDLASEHFHILRHESFFFDFTNYGKFRIFSSKKVVRFCRNIGIESFRVALHRKMEWGLHQILHGQLRE